MNNHHIETFIHLKKILRVMKLILILLIINLSQIVASTYAQTTTISISKQNESLENVLKEIEKQTEFLFFYNANEINKNERISLDKKNSNITDILNEIVKSTGISYSIKDRHIVLTTRTKKSGAESGDSRQITKRITGTVTDENGETVIGAGVAEKGTSNGVITDANGNFSLNVSENAIIQISYIGYLTQEIPVGNKTNIEVLLRENTQVLDEVVIVGYGVQKKSNLTGSVETVTSEALEKRPSTSISNMLQGHVAGMTFSTPNNSASQSGYTPGANAVMQIRGQALLGDNPTPPLVIIDGIPAEMADLNSLNPNDVESISVLKDAAASAIYGARAPYGVLIVKTKIGKRKEKANIQYSGNLGWVTPVRHPETTDTYTFALGINDARINSRQAILFPQERIDKVKDNIENPGKYSPEELYMNITPTSWASACFNTNWFDVWFKSSLRHQHNLSVKGGGEKTGYYISAGYVYQPGILNFVEKNDNYSRFNVNGSLNSQINDWMSVSYTSRYSLEKYKEPAMEYGSGRSRIYSYVYGAHPNNPLIQPDGSYSEASRVPMATQGGNIVTNNHRMDQILALDINPVKGWDIHVDGTWRMYFNDYQMHRMPAYTGMPNGEQKLIDGTESLLTKRMDMDNYWTIQGYTSYQKEINKNFFKLMAGAQVEEKNNKQLSGTAKKLVVPDIDAMRIALGDRTVNDLLSDWATAGFFGRLNYNYDERYLLEVNARYDGSGRYQRNRRWGFFPSVSGGWNISNESFWSGIQPTVNFAKLRASYGTLGNQGNASGYLHVPTMAANATQSQWIFDNARKTYINPPGILNMIRTWEKFTTFDIGAEFRFLNGRLTTEFDWFNRKSWDLIGPSTPMPSVLGAAAPESNNAEMVTKGWEAQIGWADFINKDWNYRVRLAVSDNRSKVTKYNVSTKTVSGWYEGKDVGEIWGYKVNRLLNEDDFEDGKLKISQSRFNGYWYPGDIRYEDLDGDDAITPGDNTVDNPGDMRILGNSTPRFRYSLFLSSGYDLKNFGRVELSALFEGIMKRDVWMGGSPLYYFGRSAGTISEVSIYKGHLDFYRDENSYPELVTYLGENTDAFFPRPYATTEGAKNFQVSDRYILNGAYMRLKTLQLTYTLPQRWLKRAKIANCQVYFAGENLFVLSHLPKYFDPEFVNNGRMYPQQMTLSCGINIGF